MIQQAQIQADSRRAMEDINRLMTTGAIDDRTENLNKMRRIWGKLNKDFLAEVWKDVIEDERLDVKEKTLLVIGQFNTMRKCRDTQAMKDVDHFKSKGLLGPHNDAEAIASLQQFRTKHPAKAKAAAEAWDKMFKKAPSMRR